LNPLPQGLFIPRNLKSIFIQVSVTQVSDVAHGPLVFKFVTKESNQTGRIKMAMRLKNTYNRHRIHHIAGNIS
jgi:hypothetical protein